MFRISSKIRGRIIRPLIGVFVRLRRLRMPTFDADADERPALIEVAF